MSKLTENTFQIILQATKGETELIDKFIAETKSDFFKFAKRDEHSIIMTSKFECLDYFKQSEEFHYLLDAMNGIGLKAHNAKNQYLSVNFVITSYHERTKHKVDYFISKTKDFCRKIARKDKTFKFNFNEVPHINLCKNTIRHYPIEWNSNGTVSFLFFRSTLKHSTIIATLEFVKSLFDFFETSNVLFDELYENFSNVEKKYQEYVAENYTSLLEYEKHRNIVK